MADRDYTRVREHRRRTKRMGRVPTFDRMSIRNDERRALTALLRRWSAEPGRGRVLVANLTQLEHFMRAPTMRKLCRALLTLGPTPDIVDLEVTYLKICHRLSGKGGPARTPSGIVLGRAVEERVLEKWLCEHYSARFATRAAAKRFIEKLVAGRPLKTGEQKILMSTHRAWVTFDAGSPRHPFWFVHLDAAAEVRVCLGLDPIPSQLGSRLLVFSYELPSGTDLVRPTIADAALFQFFQPPPFTRTEYGETRPWPRQFVRRKLPRDYPIQSRPEALHDPVGFGGVIRTRRLP